MHFYKIVLRKVQLLMSFTKASAVQQQIKVKPGKSISLVRMWINVELEMGATGVGVVLICLGGGGAVVGDIVGWGLDVMGSGWGWWVGYNDCFSQHDFPQCEACRQRFAILQVMDCTITFAELLTAGFVYFCYYYYYYHYCYYYYYYYLHNVWFWGSSPEETIKVTYTNARTHTRTHARVHTCIHTYIYTYIHADVHTQTHTCPHVDLRYFKMTYLFLNKYPPPP